MPQPILPKKPKLISSMKIYAQDLLELTSKRCPFHHRRLECKSKKLRYTWSNRQVWPWSTKQSRAKANSFAKRTHWSLPMHWTLFQQHKTWFYTWTSPDGQYRNQIDYILCSWRWRNCLQSAKTRPELTVAEIMNSLLPNSDLNWRKPIRKPLDHSGMT